MSQINIYIYTHITNDSIRTKLIKKPASFAQLLLSFAPPFFAFPLQSDVSPEGA